MTEVGLGYRAGGEALLVGLDIGRLSTGTWQRAAAVTAKAEEKVNSDVMEENLKEEISATLEAEGPSATVPDGMGVYITVLTDGSWQKRMGRNSFFGVGAFYGARTNKLLFCSTRVARCAICMSAAARGKQAARDHDCTKTWDERKGKDDAASNMEKAMALEGANFLFERGAVVRCIVCDGDTKAINEIKGKGPKPVADVVSGVLDLNHVAKNVGSKLRALPWLSANVSMMLQKRFQNVVYDARGQDVSGGRADSPAPDAAAARAAATTQPSNDSDDSDDSDDDEGGEGEEQVEEQGMDVEQSEEEEEGEEEEGEEEGEGGEEEEEEDDNDDGDDGMVWDDERQCWTDNATQARISDTTASNDQAARLRDAIRAIPYHYFNDHARCGPWCKAKGDPAHRPKSLPHSNSLSGEAQKAELVSIFE